MTLKYDRLTSKDGEADLVGDDHLKNMLELAAHFGLQHGWLGETADQEQKLNPYNK